MYLDVRAYRVVKDGNLPDECDDEYSVSREAGRIAVADGAADSFRAGRWARDLVDLFVAMPLALGTRPERTPSGQDAALDVAQWLAPLQESWSRTVDEEWPHLPYYSQRKAAAGAGATLLGLQFYEDHWQAVAIGDTCLFLLRHGKLVLPFPLTRSDQFDTSPDLVPSRADATDGLRNRIRTEGRRYRPGDTFVIATDALACWALAGHDNRSWATLLALESDAAFETLVRQLRNDLLVRNDDMTVVIARNLESSSQRRSERSRDVTADPEATARG